MGYTSTPYYKLHFEGHFYLGVLALGVSAIIFGWSLISKYNEIKRNRDVGQHQLVPQLLTLTMLLVGTLYQSPMISKGSLLAMIISTIEFILVMEFIGKLIEFSGPMRRRRRQIFFYFMLIGFASIFIVGILMLKIENYPKRHFLGGFLFTLATIAASCSCYWDMKLAWTTGTAEHLSLFWILAALFNAICWCVYGLIPFDKFTFLPNVFGVKMAVFQLITYAVFRNSNVLPQNASPEYELERLRDSPSSQVSIYNPQRFHLEEQRRTLRIEGAAMHSKD